MNTVAATDFALLVIGYGNLLRQDDGAGPRVIEKIEARRMVGVNCLSCAQLSPEHAEAVARARAVVFVDARIGTTGRVQLRKIAARDSPRVTTHASEPPTVLAVALEVYGQVPPAWLLTIPVEQLGFGTEISHSTRQGIDAAVHEVERLASLLPGCL